MQEKQEIHPPVRLFLSYAPEDEPLRAQLDRHLRLLQRQGLISTWHNRQILAGSDQAGEIDKQLNMASIILLLVSSDFLESDYCYSVEMQRALERAKQNEAYVIPILLRPVEWQDAPFRDLPSLPQKNKPVTTWPNLDEAFREIASGIRAAARQIHNAADRHHLPPLSLRTIAVIPDQPEITLEEAEMAYRKQVVETYQWLHFGGLDPLDLSLTNVRLEEVFVRLALTVEKVIREPVSSAESNQAEQRERVATVQEPIALGQALNDHLLIVGEPGAGKSTLLRWLAVTFAQALQRKPDRLGLSADADRLPVLVELGRLPDHYLKPESGQAPNWRQFLPGYLTAQPAFANTPPQLLAHALDNGRCLLLFDGLDEVADRQIRIRLARSLAELALPLPGNRVVIGSRPAGVSAGEGAYLLQFRRCQIERFTSGDIQRFFRFWYALDRSLTPTQQREAADALMARVQDIPATRQLASTPLLTTILLLIWRNTGDLPDRRVDLYEHCCRVLIEQWEASHDVVYQGIPSKIGWQRHLRLLAPLAYEVHSREQRTSADRMELIPLLTQSLLTEGLCSTESSAFLEAELFLDVLGLRSGLLQYIGNGRYSFPHQTFQEYLAARYIAAQPEPEYIDLVMPHLHEAWWQQVHLLTIAQLGASCAEKLILTILHAYPPPLRLWRSFRHSWSLLIELCHSWLRLILIGPGKLLPQIQLARRIAGALDREFEVATRGYAECVPDGMTTLVETTLLARAVPRLREITYDDAYRSEKATLSLVFQLFGYSFLRELMEALSDADARVQWSTQISLEQMEGNNKEVVIALLDARHYEVQDNVRESAAEILERSRSNEGLMRGLVAVLQDRSSLTTFIRPDAAHILGQVGIGDEEVARALVEALSDRDVQPVTIESLGLMGIGDEEMVSQHLEIERTLVEANRHHHRNNVWPVVIESLGQVGIGNEEVVKALLGVLHDSLNEGVQHRAARSLGQVGMGNEERGRVLLETLRKTDWFVQRSATKDLGQARTSNEEVMRVLLETLNDSDERVRWNVAANLEQMEEGNEEVVTALLEALSDPDERVHWSVAASLGQVGEGNEEVVTALLEALSDPDWFIRARVVEIMGRVGRSNERVARALLEALSDPNWRVQQSAAESLGRVGKGNGEVVTVLLKALRDTDRYVQMRAAEILGRVGGGNVEAVRGLLEDLRHTDHIHRALRQRIAESLGQMEINEEIVRVFLEALHDTDWDVRESAVKGLEQVGIGNEEVVKALLEDLRHTDTSVRRNAAEILGKVGGGNEEVVTALLEASHDPEESVRSTTAKSLGHLEIKDPKQLHQVLVSLNRLMYDDFIHADLIALTSLRRLLDGRPIPGYQWIPLRKRRAQRLRFKHTAFWLGIIVLMAMISFVATWLFGTLDSNGFVARFLVLLVSIVACIAAVAQILGWTLRDPWEHSFHERSASKQESLSVPRSQSR